MGHSHPLEGRTLRSVLREHLSAVLGRKVDKYGIVVWVDPHGEYQQVAEDVCPPGTQFLRWKGSWYRLRRELDDLTQGPEPPRLIVYQPIETPDDREDPLAEVRLAGTEYRSRLSTLIREALGTQLSPVRVEELSQARTFVEVEAALEAGGGVGVRLPSVLSTADPLQMVLRVLADDTDSVLDTGDLWDEARALLRHLLGVQVEGQGDRLRYATFKHLVLIELLEAGWSAPSELARDIAQLSPNQRRFALEVIRGWRSDSRRRGSYRDYALRLERELGLRALLSWTDSFASLDTLPVLEELARDEAIRILREGRPQDAWDLARRRLQSTWVVGYAQEMTTWHPIWNAVESMARLLSELQANPSPKAAKADEMLNWYVERGWRVDAAHRSMEDALAQLTAFGNLEEPANAARKAYETWLSTLLERFTDLVAAEPWQTNLLQQWEIHKTKVMPAAGALAYVLVDALRFELGRQLEDALRNAGVAEEIEVLPAVATPPTITPVGMASLLPEADRGLRLDLRDGGRLDVFVGGVPVRTVPDRVALLRAAHGVVADFELTEVLERSESQLRQEIAGAGLVLVRSQEIDEVLGTDHTSAAWSYVNGIKGALVRAVGRLAAAGVSRFVITSDHGFLILSRQLGPSMLMDPPSLNGALRRRCWVGQGGITPPAAVRLPMAHFGVAGNLDLVVPRGLALFRAGGAQKFLHGGLSPQELIVPVITVRTAGLPAEAKPAVRIEVVGGRITTGVFSVTVALEPDLFTDNARVHLVARDRHGSEVAKLITGQGYDEKSETIQLHASQPEQVITFRITRNLPKGSSVFLEAYGINGQLAGKTETKVAGEVEVDDER